MLSGYAAQPVDGIGDRRRPRPDGYSPGGGRAPAGQAGLL